MTSAMKEVRQDAVQHVYVEPRALAEQHLQELINAGVSFEGKSVLDLGCATGTYTRAIADMGASSVVGVDKVPANVQIANETNASPRVTFVCHDIDAWHTEDRFDFVFMRGCIYYLNGDVGELIGKICNLLAPRGELYVTFIEPTALAVFLNGLRKLVAPTPRPLQSLLRVILSSAYYGLTLVIERRLTPWRSIDGKMSTVFSPLTNMVKPENAVELLQQRGMEVKRIFAKMGLNPALSDDYGIWAASQI